jgi:biopolymer transport protein ExbB
MNPDFAMHSDLLQILFASGWVMIALAINSVLLYKTIIGLLVFVRTVRFDDLHAEELRRLSGARRVARPGRNAFPNLQIEVVEETLTRFRSIMSARLRYSKALVVAAPLLGLLGTVEGMLITFHGLSLEQRHEITRTMAGGIYRALITTETGLIVAIPALFLINWIRRESRRHELRMLDVKMQLMAQTKA